MERMVRACSCGQGLSLCEALGLAGYRDFSVKPHSILWKGTGHVSHFADNEVGAFMWAEMKKIGNMLN